MTRLLLIAALATTGCITPISSRIEVGDEPFALVVGEGKDGSTDLFAVPAAGGTFRQLTFTRVAEGLPRVSPAASLVAFTRMRDSLTSDVVVMHLRHGTEQRGSLGDDAGTIEALGWSSGSDTVVVRTDRGVWSAAIGSKLTFQRAAAEAADRLDSLTYEWVGDDRFGAIRPCQKADQPLQPCVITAAGDTTLLGTDITSPIRWGSDALAYFRGKNFEVRPLAGGHARVPTWVSAPGNPRQPTHHPGATGQ
ncbi:MAG: TolB family protein [Gemmatimonadales bacterium]